MNTNMNKRQFLRLSLGGTAALFLAPVLKPGVLLARSILLPPDYLDSLVHQQWMKLSYNRGRESRQTRRILGAVLRNLGALKGRGRGNEFAGVFDLAVLNAFNRYRATGEKPKTVFDLIQSLYDRFLYEATGPAGGVVLFGTLLALLRGRDGTPRGEAVHESYLAYRAASVRHKNAYRLTQDPKEQLEYRRARLEMRQVWLRDFLSLVDLYAHREAALPRDHAIPSTMLEGFDLALGPARVAPPRLDIFRAGPRVVVSWNGEAMLQRAPSVRGPWADAGQASPASFDPKEGPMFFRTVQPEAAPAPNTRP